MDVLAGAAGLKATKAVVYFDKNASALKAIELTREQQYLISVQALKLRADDAARLYNKYMYKIGDPTWEKLDPKIRDLLVDLNYRGDLSAAARNKIDTAASKNDLKATCIAMGDSNFWKDMLGVPKSRYDERKELICEL